jgi:hypothetical protein
VSQIYIPGINQYGILREDSISSFDFDERGLDGEVIFPMLKQKGVITKEFTLSPDFKGLDDEFKSKFKLQFPGYTEEQFEEQFETIETILHDSRPIIRLVIPNVSSLGQEIHNQAELIRHSWKDIAIIEGIYTWIPWLSRYPTFDYNPHNPRHQAAIANWASQIIGVDPVTGADYRTTGKDVKGNDQLLTIPTIQALEKIAEVQATIATSSDYAKLARIHGLVDQDGRVSAYTGKPKEKELVDIWTSQNRIPKVQEIGLDIGQTGKSITPEDIALAGELFNQKGVQKTDRYEFDENEHPKLSAIQIRYGFVTKEALEKTLTGLGVDVKGVWEDLVERGILVEKYEDGKLIGGVIQESFSELQSSSKFELSAQYDSIKEKVWKILVQSQRVFTYDRDGNLTRIQRVGVLVIPDEEALREEIDTYYALITDVWNKIAVIWGFLDENGKPMKYTGSPDQLRALATFASQISRPYRKFGVVRFPDFTGTIVEEKKRLALQSLADLLDEIDYQYDLITKNTDEPGGWNSTIGWDNASGRIVPYDGRNEKHRIALADAAYRYPRTDWREARTLDELIEALLILDARDKLPIGMPELMDQLGLTKADFSKTADMLLAEPGRVVPGSALEVFVKSEMIGKETVFTDTRGHLPITVVEALLVALDREEAAAAAPAGSDPWKGKKKRDRKD